MLSLLWRVGVVAAAIALIVLAYRIINGPPAAQEAVLPQIPEMPAIEAPNKLPSQPDVPAAVAELTPMPKIVTPDLNAANVDDLPATSTSPEGGPRSGRRASLQSKCSSAQSGGI